MGTNCLQGSIKEGGQFSITHRAPVFPKKGDFRLSPNSQSDLEQRAEGKVKRADRNYLRHFSGESTARVARMDELRHRCFTGFRKVLSALPLAEPSCRIGSVGFSRTLAFRLVLFPRIPDRRDILGMDQ